QFSNKSPPMFTEFPECISTAWVVIHQSEMAKVANLLGIGPIGHLRDFLKLAVFSPVSVDSYWGLMWVCVKLASAMQSIKGFCVSGLWKTDYCPATLGAIQNCPVQIAGGEKVSPP